MHPALCEALGCNWAEILDVVRYYRTILAAGDFEDDSVAATHQVRTLCNGLDVKARLAE